MCDGVNTEEYRGGQIKRCAAALNGAFAVKLPR
jgi:hypothetical protein